VTHLNFSITSSREVWRTISTAWRPTLSYRHIETVSVILTLYPYCTHTFLTLQGCFLAGMFPRRPDSILFLSSALSSFIYLMLLFEPNQAFQLHFWSRGNCQCDDPMNLTKWFGCNDPKRNPLRVLHADGIIQINGSSPSELIWVFPTWGIH
jgi:hypothetical protein